MADTDIDILFDRMKDRVRPSFMELFEACLYQISERKLNDFTLNRMAEEYEKLTEPEKVLWDHFMEVFFYHLLGGIS